eukprot:UN08202
MIQQSTVVHSMEVGCYYICEGINCVLIELLSDNQCRMIDLYEQQERCVNINQLKEIDDESQVKSAEEEYFKYLKNNSYPQLQVEQPVQKPYDEQVRVVEPLIDIEARIKALEEDEDKDDPFCLYILAFFALLVPLVGYIGMCCYKCGSGLKPRKLRAFKFLCGATIIGMGMGFSFILLLLPKLIKFQCVLN